METENNNQEMRYDSPLNKKESGAGAVVASIIIILIIIVGAFYFFSLIQDRANQYRENIKSPETPTVDELNTQSDSDNVSDIEADLNAESFDNLDAEIEIIEAEFNAK